jgi:hypothetical protein
MTKVLSRDLIESAYFGTDDFAFYIQWLEECRRVPNFDMAKLWI